MNIRSISAFAAVALLLAAPAFSLSGEPKVIPSERLGSKDNLRVKAQSQTGKHLVSVKEEKELASKANIADYIPDPRMISKTFLFPTETGDPKGPPHASFRRFLMNCTKDKGKTLFRCCDFIIEPELGTISFAEDVPAVSIYGQIFMQPDGSMASVFFKSDGTQAKSVIIPPSNTAGKLFGKNEQPVKLLKYLYTVNANNMQYERCLAVAGYPLGKTKDSDYECITYYAPGIGEILHEKKDPQLNENYTYAELAEISLSQEANLKQPEAFPPQAYLPSPKIKSKTFRAFPKNGDPQKLYFSEFTFEPMKSLAQKRHWARIDCIANAEAKDAKPVSEPVTGYDYVSAEHFSIIRLTVTDTGHEEYLLVPPPEHLGAAFSYAGIRYNLHTKYYTAETPAGNFEKCIAVTRGTAKAGTFDENSWTAFFAPGLGEIERLRYNTATGQFEPAFQLTGFELYK